MIRGLALVLAAMIAAPAAASTFADVKKTCPIGGEVFTYRALASISTWGSLPDGMPIGSGLFPVAMPVCPTNGLVMFRDLDAAAVKTLEPVVASADYQARRQTETSYYLAYLLATALGDTDAPWLLLSAVWEAKNVDAGGTLARRYNEAFVATVLSGEAKPGDLESVALRARAANALRELERFDEAEALRAGIVIGPDAGGSDADAVENREGWAGYLASLAAPIARRDASRAPIDMAGEREAAQRCLGQELAAKWKAPAPPPLTDFERGYCGRPELAGSIAELRSVLAAR